jgi:hypothetical protein
MFDLWSIIHFGFWAFITSSVGAVWEPPLWAHLLYTLIGSYVWEGIEYPLQRVYPERWSHRIETWQNAFIGDPICNLLGALFGWYVIAYYRRRLK